MSWGSIFLTLLLFTLVTAAIVLAVKTSRSEIPLAEATKMYKRNPRRSNLIISMTTMPKRLEHKNFQQTIAHLCAQTVRPKEIRVYIPHELKRTGERYRIPPWLEDTPVKIIRCVDYGPITKILPALLDAEPEDQFLVCDDEYRLPPNWVESYETALEKYGPDVVITGKGYSVNQLNRTYYDENTHVNVAQGYTTYYVKASMFDAAALLEESQVDNVSMMNDDIVVSYHVQKRNVKIVSEPSIAQEQAWVFTYDSESLCRNKVRGIDDQMLTRYQDNWMQYDE